MQLKLVLRYGYLQYQVRNDTIKCNGIQNMVHYLMRVCMTHTYGCTYIYTLPLLLSLPLSTFLTLSLSLPPYGLPSYILSPILLHLPLPSSPSLSPPRLSPSLHSFIPVFTPQVRLRQAPDVLYVIRKYAKILQ